MLFRSETGRDVDQVKSIFERVGSGMEGYKNFHLLPSVVRGVKWTKNVKGTGVNVPQDEGLERVIKRGLEVDPGGRWTAEEAVEDRWWREGDRAGEGFLKDA